MGVRVGLANFFLDQSIGIDEFFFYSSIKTVGATVLVDLWALEWAWHSAETNLRCAGIFGICMPNPSIVDFTVWSNKFSPLIIFCQILTDIFYLSFI